MLWAVTSFFNPLGYRKRIENFRIFRRRLNVPLLAIELGFDGRFDLTEDDADKLVRVTDGDVMFQKERLLNCAIEAHLPSECDFVAWLDADILLMNTKWADEATRVLEDRNAVLQLYSTARRIECPTSSAEEAVGSSGTPGESILKAAREGTFDSSVWTRVDGLNSSWRCGLAWAARREWISEAKLYDACIRGSGDRAWVAALIKQHMSARTYIRMTPSFAAHYDRWVHRLQQTGEFDVSFIPGEVIQMWHGDYKRRSYAGRHVCYEAVAYDPNEDLVLGREGAWRWTNPDGEMAKMTYDYFYDRREDGIAPDNISSD